MIIPNVIEIKNAVVVEEINSKIAKTIANEIGSEPEAIGRSFLIKWFESPFRSNISLNI